MRHTAILFPVFVQVALSVGLLIALNRARSASMRAQGQNLADPDVQLGTNSWSPQALKTSRCYANQFELPVLFYAVAAFAMITSAVDFLMVALAWVFAIARLAQAAIHLGPNVIAWRATAFIVGLVAVIAMWVKLALHVI